MLRRKATASPIASTAARPRMTAARTDTGSRAGSFTMGASSTCSDDGKAERLPRVHSALHAHRLAAALAQPAGGVERAHAFLADRHHLAVRRDLREPRGELIHGDEPGAFDHSPCLRLRLVAHLHDPRRRLGSDLLLPPLP